jgi:hypothetical protein
MRPAAKREPRREAAKATDRRELHNRRPQIATQLVPSKRITWIDSRRRRYL